MYKLLYSWDLPPHI